MVKSPVLATQISLPFKLRAGESSSESRCLLRNIRSTTGENKQSWSPSSFSKKSLRLSLTGGVGRTSITEILVAFLCRRYKKYVGYMIKKKNLEFRRSVSHSLENTLNTYINMHISHIESMMQSYTIWYKQLIHLYTLQW